MARHPHGAGAGQKARNRTYAIVAIVFVIVVLIAFSYGPFSENEANTIDAGAPADTNLPDTQQADYAKTSVPEVNEVITLVSPAEVTPEPNITEPKVVVLEPNLPEPESVQPLEPVVEPGAEAAAIIASAEKLIETGSSGIVAAREKLNEALRMPMSPLQRSEVKTRLSKLSDQWLFGRSVLPNDPLCESYMVQRGDTLEVIGKRYKVPWEIIQQINNISRPEALPAGGTIKVIQGPFHAKVYRSTFTMDVYLQNTYVRSYSVGLGKPGKETPTGLWRVRPRGKAYATSWRDPDTGIVYQPEDPDYPLGSRWIALDGLSGEAKGRTGFGIHGTKEPDQIGMAGSKGCIRMYNGEVIQVYNMLVDGLSQVEVAD